MNGGSGSDDILSDAYYDRLNGFLAEIRKESDRGRVLVAAALIDNMLAEILLAFFIDSQSSKDLLYSNNAPLSSLYSRTELVFSLGIISDAEHKDINLVRRIRNRFGHSVECSFSDQRISSWCSELRTGMRTLDELPNGHASRVDEPRSRFSMVTTSIVCDLYNRAHYTAKKKRMELPDELKFMDEVIEKMGRDQKQS